MSAASELPRQNQQCKNTDFRRINHRKWLVYFNALFGRNDWTQIVQEDISRYKIAVWKPPNKVEIQLLSLSPSFSSFAAFIDKKTLMNGGRRKPTESDI